MCCEVSHFILYAVHFEMVIFGPVSLKKYIAKMHCALNVLKQLEFIYEKTLNTWLLFVACIAFGGGGCWFRHIYFLNAKIAPYERQQSE